MHTFDCTKTTNSHSGASRAVPVEISDRVKLYPFCLSASKVKDEDSYLRYCSQPIVLTIVPEVLHSAHTVLTFAANAIQGMPYNRNMTVHTRAVLCVLVPSVCYSPVVRLQLRTAVEDRWHSHCSFGGQDGHRRSSSATACHYCTIASVGFFRMPCLARTRRILNGIQILHLNAV